MELVPEQGEELRARQADAAGDLLGTQRLVHMFSHVRNGLAQPVVQHGRALRQTLWGHGSERGVDCGLDELLDLPVDFVALATGTDNLELSMEEVAIAPTSPLAELTLVAANLRQRFGVIVVGIQRDSRHMEFNPPPDSTIHAGDKLVVLGRADSLKQLEVEASQI